MQTKIQEIISQPPKPYTSNEEQFPVDCAAVPVNPSQNATIAVEVLKFSEKYQKLTPTEMCREFPKLSNEMETRKRAHDSIVASTLKSLNESEAYQSLPASVRSEMAERLKNSNGYSSAKAIRPQLEAVVSSRLGTLIRGFGPESERALAMSIANYSSAAEMLEKYRTGTVATLQRPEFQQLGKAEKDILVSELVHAVAGSKFTRTNPVEMSNVILDRLKVAGDAFYKQNDRIQVSLLKSLFGSIENIDIAPNADLLRLGEDPGFKTLRALQGVTLSGISEKNLNTLVTTTRELRNRLDLHDSNGAKTGLDYLVGITASPIFSTFNDEQKLQALKLALLPQLRVGAEQLDLRVVALKALRSESFSQLNKSDQQKLLDRFSAVVFMNRPWESDFTTVESILPEKYTQRLIEFKNEPKIPLGPWSESSRLQKLVADGEFHISNPALHPIQARNLVSANLSYGPSVKPFTEERRLEQFEFANSMRRTNLSAQISTLHFAEGKQVEVVAPEALPPVSKDPAARMYLPKVEDIKYALATLSPVLRANINRVVIVPLREVSSSGMFVAMDADSTEGSIRVFPTALASEATRDKTSVYLAHEAGHLISMKGGKLTLSPDHERRWKAAMLSDPATISNYGEQGKLLEDIAETVALYHFVKGKPEERIARTLYPGRFGVLDELLKTPSR